MLDFILNSLEWKNFGWNSLTISFIATLILGTFQAWGLWKQHRTIKEKLSGECVPVLIFSYSACLFLSFLYYGFLIKSLAVIFVGLRVFLVIVLLYDLFKFGGFSTKEKLLSISFCAMIAAMIVVPRKDIVLGLAMAGGLLPAVQQPIEIWRKKSVGSADVRYLTTILAATFFWAIYWMALGSVIFTALNLVFTLVILVTVLLWFKYK